MPILYTLYTKHNSATSIFFLSIFDLLDLASATSLKKSNDWKCYHLFVELSSPLPDFFFVFFPPLTLVLATSFVVTPSNSPALETRARPSFTFRSLYAFMEISQIQDASQYEFINLSLSVSSGLYSFFTCSIDRMPFSRVKLHAIRQLKFSRSSYIGFGSSLLLRVHDLLSRPSWRHLCRRLLHCDWRNKFMSRSSS